MSCLGNREALLPETGATRAPFPGATTSSDKIRHFSPFFLCRGPSGENRTKPTTQRAADVQPNMLFRV